MILEYQRRKHRGLLSLCLVRFSVFSSAKCSHVRDLPAEMFRMVIHTIVVE